MKIEVAKYITVLDFEVGRVFQYKVGSHGNYERFITDEGHNLSNCEWMVHEKGHIWARHNVEQIEANRFYNYKLNTNEDG